MMDPGTRLYVTTESQTGHLSFILDVSSMAAVPTESFPASGTLALH